MKIVALNGLLGYGYNEHALELAFSEKVDFLGVDADQSQLQNVQSQKPYRQ